MIKLTAILPVFNGMPCLPAAVESILEQSYRDFKLLILDDGSSDGSLEYLLSIKDPRLRLITQPHRGLGSALNRLCYLADTRFIARMDMNDISAPERFEKQMSYLAGHPEIAMLGTGGYFFTAEGVTPMARAYQGHRRIRAKLLRGKAGVCYPSVIFSKAAFLSAGGYRITGAGEDLDFCLRLSEFCKVANIPEPLYGCRMDGLSPHRQDEIHRGCAYVMDCAYRRHYKQPELPWELFFKQWETRNVLCRLNETFSDLSGRFYRSSIANKIRGRQIISLLELGTAGLLRPSAVLGRLLNR
ncbi:MAG: glycosyltransferase family 2 protein [Iodobacter sp.]